MPFFAYSLDGRYDTDRASSHFGVVFIVIYSVFASQLDLGDLPELWDWGRVCA